MPKLVHVPGAGNVEFPDDFSEDQIKDALRKHFGTAAEEEKPPEKPKRVEPTVVGQDQVEFGPPPELSSEIAPLKRIGRGAMEAGGRVAQAIGMVSELGPMAPPGVYSPQIDEAWRVRMQRTLPQAIEDIRQNPIYQAGTVAREAPEELLPLTPAQKQSVIGGGLEAGAGMLGYVASGGQAPALIGAEAFTEHLVNDYDQLQKEGFSTDEAAGKAMDKALASGGIQAAIFTVLPPAFRKTADKYLVQKFGENALANFFARRAAMTGEVAGLMTTAGAAENVIAGQPITQGLGQTALGGGVLGLLTPYGQPQTATTTLPRTLKEVARSKYASRIKKAAEVHGDVRSLAVESSREVPIEEGGARVQPQTQAGIPQEGQARLLLEDNRPAVKVMPVAEGEAPRYEPAERLPSGEWETHDQIIKRTGLRTEDIDRRVFLNREGLEKPREQTAAELQQVGISTKEPGRAHSTDVNKLVEPKVEKAKPVSTEPAKPRTLTPAVRSDVDPKIMTTAEDHGTAKIKMAREHATFPTKPQNEGFLDENGNWLTRSQAADRFEAITGRRPSVSDSLHSEDLKNAGMVGKIEPVPKPLTEPMPAEGTIEHVSKLSPEEFFTVSRQWTKDAIAEKGLGPQRRAEATARSNPDLAAWEKAAADAKKDAEVINAEIRKNPKSLTSRQKEMAGAAQKAQYFAEGVKELKKMQAATQPVPPPTAEPQKPAEAVPESAKPTKPTTAAEAPKAEVSIATEEPPHGVKLDVTTPAAHPLGPIATTTTPTLAWHQILTGELKEAGAGLRGFWRSFSMQSLPRITEADRRTGELGVRYDASRTVARVKGLEFAENVLAGIKAKGFDQQFGTALAEDNLRGIRRDFQDSAQRYRAEGKTEEADAALESAGKVTTLIGARNSPFASEAQYQAFLNAPEVQQAIRRHIQLWQEQKDPIYRKANDIDPNVVLETRGLQTGARINLKAVMPEEGTRTTVGAAGRSPLIRQAVTRLRKDPFARQAKGTGTSYEGSYREIMANGYEREFPVAAQHEFIKQMIDSGLAKVTVNREFPKGMLIRGESPKAFELKIGPWRNQWLQVPRSLAEEYQNVSGLTPGWNVPVVKPLSDLLTQASVQGFAEGSTHVSNLSTGILTNLGPTANPLLNTLIKSAGRVDVLYTLPRILIRGFTSTREEMLKLAEMGAAKTPYGGLMGWFINGIDRGVRLVSADVYDGMAKKGWVKDTETGKREFINQVGQYSKRLQPTTIARLRETGVQPFATAMHTFNVQGLRTLGLGPGAKAPTALAALALRADKAAGIMGFIVLVTAINKLISGKATGPPGTQLGSVGWMGDDGKLRQFNLARAFGYERGFRTTGLQGFVEARRLGLPEATALGAGVRSIGQTGLGYVSGPATQFATKAVTGKRPGIPMVQEAKVVPPPATDELQPLKTQAAANIAIALQQANPAVDAALMAMQGKEVPDILQRQFSRYTPRAGMSQETIEAMPKIMAAKQMGDYVNALAKEARKLPLGERNKFVRDRLWEDELTAQQRAQALQRLQVKGVFRYR